MKFRALRRALLAVATIAATQVLAATPAQADGTCGTGTPWVGSTTKTATMNSYGDWTQTVASDYISYSSNEYYTYMNVWDSSCSYVICSTGYYYYGTCYLGGYQQHVNVEMVNGYGYTPWTYTLNSDGVDLPDVDPAPQCSDGIDNDLNGSTDYPNDPGCNWYDDNTESSAPAQCNPVLGVPVCAFIENGDLILGQTLYGVTTYTAATHTVVGSIDRYRFPLTGGGSIVAPCVTLKVNGSGNNPCTQAGGTYVSTLASLVNQSVNQPGVTQGPALATVRICEATLTATAAGLGVEDFPIVSVC